MPDETPSPESEETADDVMERIQARLDAMAERGSGTLPDFEPPSLPDPADMREDMRIARDRNWAEKVPPRYRDANLETLLAAHREIADDWLVGPPRNLIFCGANGTGKTYLAYAIARAAYARGAKAKIWEMHELIEATRPNYDNRELHDLGLQIVQQVKTCDLLVLDDLRMEKLTEASEERLHGIVNHRYQWQLPIIVTTNLNADELDKKITARIYSKLTGGAEILSFEGRDRRRGAKNG